jgi:two-component system, NtrC family, nitrogen regulation response regulator GlnG
VILSDVRMSGLDGVALLRLLRERHSDADVILMTAFDDMSTVVSAMREGAAEFLVKPLDLHDLRRVIERVFDDRRARARAGKRNDATTQSPTQLSGDALIGRDPRMLSVYKLIGHAAVSRATALIRGETGTGKELVARAIHANSAESKAPFIAVNCAALPANLLESELFGHVRGAFTGATGDRRGRFAHGGAEVRAGAASRRNQALGGTLAQRKHPRDCALQTAGELRQDRPLSSRSVHVTPSDQLRS